MIHGASLSIIRTKSYAIIKNRCINISQQKWVISEYNFDSDLVRLNSDLFCLFGCIPFTRDDLFFLRVIKGMADPDLDLFHGTSEFKKDVYLGAMVLAPLLDVAVVALVVTILYEYSYGFFLKC